MGLHEQPLEDAFNEYLKLYEKTEEVCKKHKINLIKPPFSKAFCVKCAEINAAHDEATMINNESDRAIKNEKEKNNVRRWLKRKSIVTNKAMFDMTFENFNEVDEETKINKQKALKVAQNYYKGHEENEILVGKFGTGKSHLAMAILNKVNEHKDIKALFVSMDELFRKIKSSFNVKDSPYTEDAVVNMLIETDLLVLDDLGAEVGSVDRNSSASDFNVRVLNGVLNGRLNKPIIFTTNLTMKELINVYDGRLISRMFRGIEQDDIIAFSKTSDKRTKIKF